MTAPTTDEFWAIDGVPLNQYGWNIATFGGSRYDLPPKRGENQRLAYRQGSLHRPKLADERTIMLDMWVSGMDPATGAAVADTRLRFNDSWDFLRRLVWKPMGAQVTLTRRWWLTDALSGDAGIVVADGLAEVVDTMAPTMTGRTRATFSMSLLMADPFFYGRSDPTDPDYPATTVPLTLGTAVSVYNPGHDFAAHNNLTIDLIGPLTNPVLTNRSNTPQIWVKYAGTIAAGRSVRLSVGDFQATQIETGINLIRKIVNGGSQHWMGLLPRANDLLLTADAGTGSALLRFRPPYV